MEPLVHRYSKNRVMSAELVEDISKSKIVYDPLTQTSDYSMGGKSTACHKSTDGTKPKNEADKVMDDN